MKILITGGAGFVGSSLAKEFRTHYPSWQITCFDNLRRRGSEYNLADFKAQGINFVHGDIRQLSDLMDLGQNYDVLIEASAESSVHSGNDGRPDYVLQTNLAGTINCLEFARKHAPRVIYLSTSRVYAIESLTSLPLKEGKTRLELNLKDSAPRGLTKRGVGEDFEIFKARSLYGATKLASELLIQEYVETFELKAVVNRCGAIAGPGQWGKVDQGVFTLWVVNHYFKKRLRYTGFGGTGKQVRDLLHPHDLFQLLVKQIDTMDRCSGEVFNIGGGQEISTSLCELTGICEEVTGNSIEIGSIPETAKVDIPWYVTDFEKAEKRFGFRPQKCVRDIVSEIHLWLKNDEQRLKEIFS